jgi:nucleoside-diphosphate-sugar epimerase
VRAFVTGATGFVGSHLAEALVARGDEVIALSRRPESSAFLATLGARPAPGALDDDAKLAAALAGVDVVYHVAGLTAAANEAAFLAVNERGTQVLLEVVRRAAPGVQRFVLVSSHAALGPSRPDERLAEDAACRPLTAYGRSKLAGERAVRGADIPWTIVRPPAVYGPRDREFLRLFRLVKRGISPVFGWGRQQLSLVYVTDLAEALVRAATAEDTVGQVYHVAHPEVVLSRDIGRAIGMAIGRRPFLLPVPGALAGPIVGAIGRAAAAAGRPSAVNSDKMAEFLAPAWLLSVEKAERELGWRAAHDLTAGMAKTAAWYLGEGLL